MYQKVTLLHAIFSLKAHQRAHISARVTKNNNKCSPDLPLHCRSKNYEKIKSLVYHHSPKRELIQRNKQFSLLVIGALSLSREN